LSEYNEVSNFVNNSYVPESNYSSLIDKVFTLLEEYKDENIESYNHVKSLVDAVIKKLHSISNNTQVKQIIQVESIIKELNSASSYSDKLKKILQNENTIKNILKNHPFNNTSQSSRNGSN
jgi:hypothetical protein